MSSPSQLILRERLQRSSSHALSESCCFHSLQTSLHCSCCSFMCTLQPSNRQRSNETHTQYDVPSTDKRCVPTQSTNFVSARISIAVLTCFNSNASASLMKPTTKHVWNSCVVSHQHFQAASLQLHFTSQKAQNLVPTLSPDT